MSIKSGPFVKLLGVYLDEKLNFSHHIKYMSNKWSRQLNAIARLSRKLSRECKLRLMKAFIMSNFNLCSIVYHHCKISDTHK